jgi:flagellar biosynthetic protein FlhB
MSASSSSEQTEAPTARKLRQARDQGQVARSTELPAAAVTISAMLIMFLIGGVWVARMSKHFAAGFTFDRQTLDSPNLLPTVFGQQMADGLLLVLPLLLLTAVTAILASGATGGYLFSLKSILPNFGKLNPGAGLARIFGTKAWVELLKSMTKLSLIGGVLWILVNRHLGELLHMGQMSLQPALEAAGLLIAESALWLSLCLLFIALIDAPYQKYAFIKSMRMTKQEVKDEMKDMEGKPEVKAKIRQRQREMSNARMIQKVKDADVVITNPEHFAVALSYDPAGDGAPILLAKGTDHIAARIREEAKLHGIEIFASPPLARAIYFTTETDRTIPEALYYAVAQVLAYVFNLAQIQPGVQAMQRPSPKLPKDMQFDAEGQLVNP